MKKYEVAAIVPCDHFTDAGRIWKSNYHGGYPNMPLAKECYYACKEMGASAMQVKFAWCNSQGDASGTLRSIKDHLIRVNPEIREIVENSLSKSIANSATLFNEVT
jgi:hypothetical protein